MMETLATNFHVLWMDALPGIMLLDSYAGVILSHALIFMFWFFCFNFYVAVTLKSVRLIGDLFQRTEEV